MQDTPERLRPWEVLVSINDDNREFVPASVRLLADHLAKLIRQEGIDITGDALLARYRFWVEDSKFWIVDRQGNEVSFHDFIVVEVAAEKLKHTFIAEMREGRTKQQ